jgi:uncharacterized protein (TIGR02246 family)
MKAQQKKLQNLICGISAIALFSVCPSFLNAQATEKVDISAETRDKIDQLNQQLSAAMQSGDMNKVMELYTDDATMMLPGGKSLKGKKEISEYLSGIKNIKNIKLNVIDAGGAGKIMYQVGKVTYVTTVDGKEKEETSDFVMVLKRQPDWDYKISVNSTN